MFTFLKKHYEKIILTFLLFVFVVLLVIQLSMLLEGMNVKKEELTVNLNPDYQRLPFKDPKYGVLASLANSVKWAPAEPRNPKDKIFTDLCAPLELARCPFCEHLVPVGDFRTGKCSYCEHVLPEPPAMADPSSPSGIPINILKKYKGVPESDLDLDYSKNGFTNREKMLGEYDLQDPKSHPPYATKLSVVEVVRKKLNMKVENIVVKGDDKTKWTVQLKIMENGKERTRFPTLASNKIKGDDGEYVLVDIKPEFKTEPDAKLNANVEKNYSKAIFQKAGSEETLVGEIGKDIVESKEKIILLYAMNNKKIDLYVGDSISLGDERTGVEKYIVIACDPVKGSVSLKKDDASNKVYELLPRKLEPLDAPASPFPPGFGAPPPRGGKPAPAPGGAPLPF